MNDITVHIPPGISLIELARWANDQGHKLRAMPDGSLAMLPRQPHKHTATRRADSLCSVVPIDGDSRPRHIKISHSGSR